jgi:hypothetical protein
MNKRIFLTALVSLFIIGTLVFPVFSAPLDTLSVHAQIEGRALVKTEDGWTYAKDAVITFWTYTPSGTVPDHSEPGWAITLTVGDTLYVWHVTKIRTCRRSNILIIKADPHPLPGVDNAEPGPSPIRVILRHNPDRPLAIAVGGDVFFIGKTLPTA